jgi:hypothetical protein
MTTIKKSSTAPVLVKLSAIEDQSTRTWYDCFEFRDHLGRRQSISVPADIAGDPKKLLAALQRAGARLPRDLNTRKRLIDSAIVSSSQEIVCCAARPGWQTSSSSALRFSYGDKIFGEPIKGKTLSPPFDVKLRGPSGVEVRGDLREWQRRVGIPVTRSPCATLTVAAAFAAPLLLLAEMNSFGIHIYGKVKRGKTTALTAGGSVIGLGKEEKLPNWNSTNASILEKAMPSNDLFLPINEVGAMQGKRSDAYLQLRELTFAFAEGRERGRHGSFAGTPLNANEPFRVIFGSTAEHSMTEYAALAGQLRDGGESFRLVEFPAVVSKTDSIFEVLPEGKTGLEATDDLRAACRECSGTPFLVYLPYLTSRKPDELKRYVMAAISEFLAYVKSEATDAVSRHVARTFGVLYAGALMASEADVWHWTKKRLLKCMRYCFRIAMLAAKPVDPLPEALELLRSHLQGAAIVQGSAPEGLNAVGVVGYWEPRGSTRVFAVNVSAFKSWFGNTGRASLVLQALHSRKLLLSASGSGGSQSQLTAKDIVGQTLRWPNGKVVRSHKFLDPFPAEGSQTSGRLQADIIPPGGLPGMAYSRNREGKITYWDTVTVNKIEEGRVWVTWDGAPEFEPEPVDLDSVAIKVRALVR